MVVMRKCLVEATHMMTYHPWLTCTIDDLIDTQFWENVKKAII